VTEPSKTLFVKIGDFFFKYRNIVFPLFLFPFFVFFKPAAIAHTEGELLGPREIAALVVVFSGLAFRLATIGWAYIKRGGLNKEVYANTLVIEGYFGLCRNPLYVGNMLIYSGLFLFHGNPFVVVLGIGLYWFIYESIIAAEEHFLKQKFGPEYDTYCQAVPRWIPNVNRYKQSIQGMTFQFDRCLTKDYTTIYNTLFALIAVEVVRDFYRDHALLWVAVRPWAVALVGLTVALSLVKVYKKRLHKKQS
jgi:protein-S-isoprenylcysteine O-methyltransferase Ste14